ncbi:MAG: phosphoserine phosphatase SerB [Rhodospirillales bacterium]
MTETGLTVVTFIAPGHGPALEDSILRDARARLNALGGEAGPPDWLAEGRACDVFVDGLAPGAAEAAARAALAAAGFAADVIAQPAEGRRKRLLAADMDSTIVTSETLDDLAAEAGLGKRIAAVTARAMRGEIDFEDALHERVGLLAGLSETALARVWDETRLASGAETLVRTMKAHGALTILVSGGFTYFTGRAAAACGFERHFGNTLEIKNGALTGRVIPPVLGGEAKYETLRAAAAELRIPMAETLAVGDGANDARMVRAAGLGCAFCGKPVLREAAAARVDHADLTALLYAQGYRAEEFAG